MRIGQGGLSSKDPVLTQLNKKWEDMPVFGTARTVPGMLFLVLISTLGEEC